MDIKLREATPQDFEFLYRLHRETLKATIDQTWGWDEAWQQAHFRAKFDLSGKKDHRMGWRQHRLYCHPRRRRSHFPILHRIEPSVSAAGHWHAIN